MMSCHRVVTIGYCFVVLWSVCVEVVYGLPGYYPDNQSYDLCKESRLAFSFPGTHGQIVFNSSSLKPLATNPCILRLETCSSCRFKIQMPKFSYIDFFCEGHTRSNSGCSLSCDYMYMFDTNYMNDTLIYYDNWGSFKTDYVSLSNNVFIGLCHGYREKYSIIIDFEVERKVQMISGTPEYKRTGVFMSPLFPKQYSQNEEMYEYNLTNQVPGGVIQVMFSDWHLAASSDFIFENSNIVNRVGGESIRPVVISNSNTMMVRFHTGASHSATSSRDFIGFKATYQLLSDRSMAMANIPSTNCKGSGYLFNEFGGAIDFDMTNKRLRLYDCLWVIKKQPGYSGIYLKILKYTSPRYVGRGINKLFIKSGLTSNGYTVIEIDQEDKIEDGIPYKDTKGFYIRLNGTYTYSDTFKFVYASYQAHYDCQPNMYQCASGICIHPSLKCDGYDHCGDNSDETTVCGDPASHWDKSYQYTVTIGVIIPMVISVFLIMVICLLFVMIRRCRRVRMQEAGSSERLRTLSEDVSRTRGRRRRRHRRNMFGERDMPPTYDEAMQNPPGWYLNVAFANPVDPSLPQPPSYTEAMRQQGHSSPARRRPGSPDSSDSSQSELTICSRNQSASSSSSDEEERWFGNEGNTDGRRARRSRHVSSSDTDRETEVNSERTRSSSGQTVRENNTQTPQLQPRASPSTDITPYYSDQEGKKTGRSEHFEMSEKSDKNDPKKTDGPTDCVVPDHDKVDTEPGTLSYASRIVQSVLGTRTGSHRQQRADRSGNHSRQRSMSSESEAVGDESRKKGKKKAKKSKNKRSKSSRKPATECLSEQTDPSVIDQVPLPTVGASNFTTDDIPSHSQSRVEGPNSSELEHKCRVCAVRNNTSEKPNPEGSEDSLNYELVVNVDTDDVMLVYDTHFCDIPQHRDHFSQSRSRDAQIHLLTDDPSDQNDNHNDHTSPPLSHEVNKPDAENASDHVTHVNECDESGIEGLHVRQNRDNDPITHVPLDGVQYISIRSDDLSDDIYV